MWRGIANLLLWFFIFMAMFVLVILSVDYELDVEVVLVGLVVITAVVCAFGVIIELAYNVAYLQKDMSTIKDILLENTKQSVGQADNQSNVTDTINNEN